MSSSETDDERTYYFPGTTRIAEDEYVPILARYVPAARLHKPSIGYEDDELGWYGALPDGEYLGPYRDMYEALVAVEETLRSLGWVTDLELAKRRAEEQVELRKLGKLKPPDPSQ